MDSSMAIDRIRDEMAREHTNPLITQVGEYVTNVLLSYPEEAEHVTDSKHLSQCFEEIYKYASAHRLTILGGKQAAYVGPEETAQIIDKYYGFTKAAPGRVLGRRPRKIILRMTRLSTAMGTNLWIMLRLYTWYRTILRQKSIRQCRQMSVKIRPTRTREKRRRLRIWACWIWTICWQDCEARQEKRNDHRRGPQACRATYRKR